MNHLVRLFDNTDADTDMDRGEKDVQRNSKFFRGAWRRISNRPTIQTVGKAEIPCQPVRVLAALSACLLFQAYFIPFTNGCVTDIAQFSSALETGSSPSLDVSSLVALPSYDTGTSHKRLALAGDVLVCVETEDPDPFDEDLGHPHAFAEASLNPQSEFSSHDSPRASFLPFLAIHGLMSRRF
jgi:hypothetical protein